MGKRKILSFFGITEFYSNYVLKGFGTKVSLPTDASFDEKFDFMSNFLKQFGYTDDPYSLGIPEDFISVRESPSGSPYLREIFLSGGNTYNSRTVIPLHLNYEFYDLEGKVLSVIGILVGSDLMTDYRLFYKFYDDLSDGKVEIEEIAYNFKIVVEAEFRDDSFIYIISEKVDKYEFDLDGEEDSYAGDFLRAVKKDASILEALLFGKVYYWKE